MEITKSGLISRTIRSAIGLRRLDLSMTFQEQEEEQENGIIRFIRGAWNAVTGFISNAVNWVRQINFSQLFGMVVSNVQKIWNFNWNATDAQLRASLDGQRVGVYGVWGSAFGNAFGWVAALAVGGGIAYVCPVIGGATLAKAIAGEVLPEAIEEVGGSFQAAVNATASYFSDTAITNLYINYRKFIKRMPEGVLATIYGEDQASWLKNQWGNAGEPNISFANAQEEWIENHSPEMRAFWENFFDEAWDGFTEAGYLIAGELDAAMNQAKAANRLSNGKERTIEIIPDKRNDRERVIITGTEKQVKEQTIQYLNEYRQIRIRDVGQIVGMPAEDYYRAKPQRRKLTIVFKSIPSPPYWLRDGSIRSATYTIPDPKPNLSWNKIKLAAKFYNWGKFRATANLDNGRQMAVYGATAEEAENKLKELLELTTAEISTLSIAEEKDRNPRLRKNPMLMYPAYGSFLIRRPTTDANGRTFTDNQTYDESTVKFDLWCDTEPEEFSLIEQTISTPLVEDEG